MTIFKRYLISISFILVISLCIPIFVFSASDIYSSSALTYFSGGQYYWSYNPGTWKNLCDTETYTAVRDWSIPFPDNELVNAGYFSTDKNLGVNFTGLNDGTIPSYPNTMCTIHFTKPMNFVSGLTYQFCLRINSFMLKALDGTAVYFDERLDTVICKDDGNSSMRFSVKAGTTNYENDYLLTFKPTSDIAVDSLVFLFTSAPPENQSNSGNYDICTGSFTFSNMISYTGNGDYVSTNPQLDNISGQLEDINNAINNNPYGEITAPNNEYQDALESHEINAIAGVGDVIGNANAVFNEIPSTANTWWGDILSIVFAFPIFAPFIVVGVAFLMTRALLSR